MFLPHTLEEVFCQHRLCYPLSKPQDWLKLLYQAEFGPGHLAPAPDACRRGIAQEAASLEDRPVPPPFWVGGGLCRMPLSPDPAEQELLARAFWDAAQSTEGRGSREGFVRRWEALRRQAPSLGLDTAALEREAAAFLAQPDPLPPMSHSPAFRAAYHPHYRLISGQAAFFWPVLKRAAALQKEAQAAGRTALLAIDGRCASGKSTLAALLGRLLDCPVVHLDDFFLPPALRTRERLAQPGENVHWERFAQEVLQPLSQNRDACFAPFCCRTGDFSPNKATVPAGGLVVAEGSYSLHPALASFYQEAVFLTVEPAVQTQRLAQRNPDMLPQFLQRWVPLEERYIAALAPQERAALQLDTSGLPPVF